MRVIYADDNRLCRQNLNSYLITIGAEIVGVAKDGKEAVALCAALRPDVVLLDASMGEHSGEEAARAILAAGTARHVVLATSQVTLRDHVAPRLGIPIILKPYHVEQLRKLLNSLDAPETVAVGE